MPKLRETDRFRRLLFSTLTRPIHDFSNSLLPSSDGPSTTMTSNAPLD